MPVRLNLLVIRSDCIERAASFYAALGFDFGRHVHGRGPEHFAAEDAGLVFEIYPRVGDASGTAEVRLGFAVDSVDDAVAALVAKGAKLRAALRESPWGRRAVVEDLDGHAVELTAKSIA